MSLVEFLLARIGEDEARVEFVRDFIPEHGDQGEYIDPARVLAECESKRSIIKRYMQASAHLDVADADVPMVGMLRDLAAVYADHADYDEAWRP